MAAPFHPPTMGALRARPRHGLRLGLGVALWTVATLGGLATLLVYGATPGSMDTAPVRWPGGSTITPGTGSPTLVLFVHPKCPCSRATVAELAEIMKHIDGNLSVTVLMLSPGSETATWGDTRLARTAAAIPGVIVRSDHAGAEEQRFKATISGETFVYDAQGRLRFHGGITGARGHVGDNRGRHAVETIVLCGASADPTTPAFGCPLRSPGPVASPRQFAP